MNTAPQNWQDRTELLANRLAFDRDIAMELRLRRMEPQIADDMILSALSHFQGADQAIQSRIADYYFAGGERDYLVTARVFNEFNNTRQAAMEYNAALRDGGEENIRAMLPDKLPEKIQTLYDHARE